MTGTLHGAGVALALLATAAALLAGLVALVATRRPAVALPVFLDLLVAAGLLRLVGQPSWPALAPAAAILVLRRLIGFGLRTGGRTWVATRPDGSSRVPDLRRLVRPAWRASADSVRRGSITLGQDARAGVDARGRPRVGS